MSSLACRHRASRASVSWVSVPPSPWKPHTRSWHRGAMSSSYTACRVDFVFLRRWLTHPCSKPRVYRWRLHVCVRSRVKAKQQWLPWFPTKLATEPAELRVVVAVVVWSLSMSARVSFTLSSTKMTIEFDKLRRRPRRDSHGACRLSEVYSHLLGH